MVGKAALPAVVVPSDDPVDATRSLVRDGDVLLVVGPGHEPSLVDVCRRTPAWGVETIWIGAGDRPDAALADHLVWTDDDPARVSVDGRLILVYHLLWELTQVCLEHAGRQLAEPEPSHDVCITCADEALVAEVVDVTDGAAVVRLQGTTTTVDTTLVDTPRPHDLVLVHAGIVLSTLDEPVAAT